jgi:tetratricopeptide (TPR) repeat protein
MAKSKHNRKGKSRNHLRSRYPAGISWRDGSGSGYLEFSDIEIHGEQPNDLDPEVESLLRASLEYLRQGDGSNAERLLRTALEIDPDNPALLNNLAMALGLQAKREQAEALTLEIHRRFPAYAFGHINLALILIEKGEYDRARKMLNSLLERKRLHFAEFSAIAGAQIKLALVEGDRDEAEHWLDLMKQVDPDDPHLKPLRALVKPSLLNFFR